MSYFYNNYWDTTSLRGDDSSYKLDRLEKFIPKEKNLNVLDFGCGDARILKKIGDKTWIKTGVDVSEVIINKNRKNIKNIKFDVIVDGKKLPFKKNMFDLIISTDSIEHVYNTKLAFKELSRILKPNGKIIFTTPYHGFIKNLVIILSNNFDNIFDPLGAHIRFFTKDSMSKCLIQSGIKPIKFAYYGRFYPLSRGMIICGRKI